MEKIVVTGPTPLKGEVTINGAKNAAVAILPAALLIDGVCTIENLPNISDIKISCEILENLGAKITWNNKNSITIDSTKITSTKAPLDLTSKFRASYYIVGAMLGRMGEIEVGMPGGCKLGARPIDQHIKGFELLGANVNIEKGTIYAKAKKLKGSPIYMDIVSVGATINVMLASVLAKGTTIIDNAAKEPHIVDVANFLNTMGADIRGAGTDVIKINGVDDGAQTALAHGDEKAMTALAVSDYDSSAAAVPTTITTANGATATGPNASATAAFENNLNAGTPTGIALMVAPFVAIAGIIASLFAVNKIKTKKQTDAE